MSMVIKALSSVHSDMRGAAQTALALFAQRVRALERHPFIEWTVGFVLGLVRVKEGEPFY